MDLTLLGQGGMGAVYRGRDPDLDRQVAIKVILDRTPDFVGRFRREAQAIARLAHPSIVQIYDFGLDDEGNPYFVMELVDGTPLDEVIRQRGRLPPRDAVRFARQAAEGLQAAHAAGIIHRDVKPSNVIVDARGLAKLVDFGIARVVTGGPALTQPAALMGTPGYMAPEQAMGQPVDHRADIYALGLTLHEMLAGRPPFEAADALSLMVKNLRDPLPDLRSQAAGVPEDLVWLVTQMGAKDREQRPQSAGAVVQALAAIETALDAAERPARPTPATVPERVAPASTNRCAVVLAAGGALALAAAVVVVVTRDGGSKAPGPTTTTEGGAPAATRNQAPGPLRVSVLPFKNVGRDGTLTALEEGIAESCLSSIDFKRVKLLERANLQGGLGQGVFGEIDAAGDFHFDKTAVVAAGHHLGAQVVVVGAFQKHRDKLRITARLVRVEDGRVLEAVALDAPGDDPLEAQDRAAAELSRRLIALADRWQR